MLCRITDLRYKEVINVRDGSCLGCVSDIEVDTVTAKVVSLIIYGKCKLLGLFFRGEDIIIRWCDIEVIGEDTILVNMRPLVHEHRPPKPGFFGGSSGRSLLADASKLCGGYPIPPAGPPGSALHSLQPPRREQ